MQVLKLLKFIANPLSFIQHLRRSTLLLLIVSVIVSPSLSQQKIKVSGTGQTTGHIANLTVTHEGPGTIHIASQTAYIPSSGQYQSYVAIIPETPVPPGTTIIPIQGYCTDVHLLPVPNGKSMPSLEKWVPVGNPNVHLPKGYIPAVPGRTVFLFAPGDIPIITSSNYYYTAPDASMHTGPIRLAITWPGTETIISGTFEPDIEAVYRAKVLVTAFERIDDAYDIVKAMNKYATPLSSNPEKERESVIQQTLWIYAAALNGQPYTEEDFSINVYEQFAGIAGLTINTLTQAPKQELNTGIRKYWNAFLATGVEAKVINSSSWEVTTILREFDKGNEVLPATNPSIVPWSQITLTGATMKLNNVSVAVGKSKFPLVPVLFGVGGLGVGTYAIIAGGGDDDENCSFSVSLQSTAATCGQSDGRIALAVSPSASYTYVWSNGAMTEDLINVPAGMYSVTVSRTGTSCTQTASATVSNTTANFNATVTTQNADCGKQNGTTTVSVNPAGAYTYFWSNGSTQQNQNNLAPGNYSVTVSDAGACQKTYAVTIGENPFSVQINLTSTPSGCGLSNGTITATVNPPGAYNYEWSNGQSGTQATGLMPGSYTLTVSLSGSNCTQTQSITVDESPAGFTVTLSSTPAGCGLANGTATATVNPPGNYEYAWSNGQTGSQINGASSGSYTVTVTIPGTTCSKVASTTIEELPSGFTVTISSTPAGCGLTDGTATATVNPPGNYEYVWSNGQTGSQISGLSSGSYTVTVNVAGSTCSQEASTTVNELPPGFTVSVSSTPAGCGLTDGTATASVNPPGNYEYTWSNGQTGSQISGLSSGSYTVTVNVTGSACSQEASTTVNELPPGFTVSISSTPAGCGLTDGTATATVNPPGNYEYAWSNGQTGSQITGVSGGVYTVTVTIAGTACAQEATASINELPPGFTVSASSTPAGCGLSDGTASVTVNPPGTYNYAWSNGQTGPLVTGLLGGNYNVTVSIPGSNCSQETSVVVDQLPPSFSLSFSTIPAGCGLSNGSATVTANPPGTYTYLWSNGASAMQIDNVPAGDYTVTVSVSGIMCSSTGSVHIGQTGGGFTPTFVTDNATCGLSNGSATITIDPPSEYTYVWSNGQSGDVLEPVSTGNYSVTVTDAEGCSESFSVFVGQDAAEYINILNIIPGNCTGGGNVTFSATTPGAGPLDITITGPSGTNNFTVTSGVHSLSTFINVLPGAYTLTVIDQGIGPSCSETVNASVSDITPLLEALYDDYETEGAVPVEGNVLDNDEGLNIQMTQVDNEVGGTVTFSANGDFVFIADIGFFGEASFVYTITDACGNTAMAIVYVDVEEVPCDIEVVFDSTMPSCGFEDGEITADVIEPGSYEYDWSNGESGPTIQNIPAGSYFVTVTDLNLGCTLEASTLLQGIPSDYIEDINIIQPTCEAGGDIEFTAISPAGNTLTMVVDHPNGSGVFQINAGLIQVSDYVTTVPGEYFIEVSDPDSGPGCMEDFSATLSTPPNLQIVVVEAIPPSEPDGNDGSAFVEVTLPGQFPYAVYVNGMFAFTVSQNNFFVINLEVGMYTVHVVDVNACQSNIVEFEIPLPEGVFSFGTGIIQSGLPYDGNEQPGVYEVEKIWRSTLIGRYQYYLGNVQEEIRLLYAIPVKNTPHGYLKGFVNLELLTRMEKLNWKGLHMKLQGGIGGQYISPAQQSHWPHTSSVYWLCRMNAGYEIKKRIQLNGNLTIRGWNKIEPVLWDFNVALPFYSWRRSGI